MISSNSLNDCCLNIYDSEKNELKDNEISDEFRGMRLYDCEEITLSGNRFNNAGLDIIGDLKKHWNTHDIDTKNRINGRSIYYFKNKSGGTVPNNAAMVIITDCENMLLEDLEISEIPKGVFISYSSYSI